MSTPDRNIFPRATGEAANTVAKHQEAQELVFYSGWFCPFVQVSGNRAVITSHDHIYPQRTWIVLEERGIPYQYKEVGW